MALLCIVRGGRACGRPIPKLLVLAAALQLALGMGGCTPVTPPQPQTGVTDVSMQNIAFVPKIVTIKPGESVRWTNQESSPIQHTTTSGDPGAANVGALWDSEILNPGASFTHKFDEAGEFTYYCGVHPQQMRDAKVIVQP